MTAEQVCELLKARELVSNQNHGAGFLDYSKAYARQHGLDEIKDSKVWDDQGYLVDPLTKAIWSNTQPFFNVRTETEILNN